MTCRSLSRRISAGSTLRTSRRRTGTEDNIARWEDEQQVPAEVRRRAYAAGIQGALWPREFGGTPPEGSEGDWSGAMRGIGVDPFFDYIMHDEFARCGSGGVLAALFAGNNIGLPPVISFGAEHLKRKVVRDVVEGRKSICLAITEPSGGSDVSALRTTARLEGDVYVVNGSKKWITGALHADFFTVVVRTAQNKLSMLLMEKGMPGMRCRRMKTQGWWTSATTFITFDDVRVPKQNLIGREGEGFKYTMINFNHERFMLAVQCNRFARVCIEDAVRWARRRKTFGKRLIEHQVIRHKVAQMGQRVEATQHMIEHYCYQVKQGCPDIQLGGAAALLKLQATDTMEYCAKEASQIFGGASFTREGAGARVERIYREVRVMAIGGGSAEIMRDLVCSQAKL
eukprot:TRINITY_DN2341_c1_g1_i2.p1 TRINITY_DN2341_c1_g1~~TRINITY_DN2341_c1_g1_i2.p1  ORF type:complete len:424 (+),score=141.42 TRINITY_DN2341_c1_g1_i2:76-1272(+)